jgi:hypothetical protein
MHACMCMSYTHTHSQIYRLPSDVDVSLGKPSWSDEMLFLVLSISCDSSGKMVSPEIT